MYILTVLYASCLYAVFAFGSYLTESQFHGAQTTHDITVAGVIFLSDAIIVCHIFNFPSSQSNNTNNPGMEMLGCLELAIQQFAHPGCYNSTARPIW